MRKYRTIAYAFGILRNRMDIRLAQHEPIFRWLENLKAHGYTIAEICDLCSRVSSTKQFYDECKLLFELQALTERQ